MSFSSTDQLATGNTRRANTPVWLFSPSIDLASFLGSALVSLLLLVYGNYAGLLDSDTPSWAWVPFILLLDVAHVYATGFRVYFDRDELQRRPLLYYGTPITAFGIGWAVYSESPDWFWRILAYMAVFHFVRQQYGWVAMYRAKAGEPGGWQKWVDSSTIYLATLYPLIYWHANLPREFWWFREWDFFSIPTLHCTITVPIYWIVMAAYFVKSLWQWRIGRANLGKDIVVATTLFCWYVGIITFNSDYAFTVTNVIIHAAPYIALTYCYVRSRQRAKQRARQRESANVKWNWLATLTMILATIWVLAYVEHLLWDKFIWQDRPWLFGPPQELDTSLQSWLAALLAMPQATHYILDGFIWRRRSNPVLKNL